MRKGADLCRLPFAFPYPDKTAAGILSCGGFVLCDGFVLLLLALKPNTLMKNGSLPLAAKHKIAPPSSFMGIVYKKVTSRPTRNVISHAWKNFVAYPLWGHFPQNQ